MPRTTREFNARRKPISWPGWLSGCLLVILVSNVIGSDLRWAMWGLLIASFASAVGMSHLWVKSHGDLARREEVQLAIALLTVSFVSVDLARFYALDLFALVYLVLALVITFQSRIASIVSVGIALITLWLSVMLPTFAGPEAIVDMTSLLSRSAFVVLFGVFAFAVHGVEILERRIRHRDQVEAEREGLMRQAREFRLLSTSTHDGTLSRKDKEELITREAVDAINHAVYVSLSLLKSGLNAHTAVLFWFDVSSKKLQIKELVSDSDCIIETSLDPAKGLIGGITRRREPVMLNAIRPGYRGLSYYRQDDGVRGFVGVPVLEDGHLRGVLCVDRNNDTPFTDADVELAQETGRYIVRAVENERVFSSIEKSKNELGRFFDASRQLNGALTLEEVFEVALTCAGDLMPFEFAAVTTYDPETDTHEISAIRGTSPFDSHVDWKDHVFKSNAGLVSMVVKNRHYLPYGGVLRDNSSPVVFEEDQLLQDLKSMLILPLIVQDQPIGTIVMAHRQANLYTAERREMFEIVANQVAITLQNARLYDQMEEMATTDGLTGLCNHRTFQARMDEAIARHRRSNRSFGMVLTDIDHFKNVNDTYGHPVGDEVLRQVSALFRETLRETDVAARYGGEEFALILEDTDLEGCMMIADRLREQLKEIVFETEKGPFSCTISMGVGYWPLDSSDKQELIDLADQALYHSKGNGRDRVTAYQDIAKKAS